MILKSGGVETLLDVISKHIRNEVVCKSFCDTLRNISKGSYAVQERICEKGGLKYLLDILGYYKSEWNIHTVELCVCAIKTVLSSKKTHSVTCDYFILNAVERARDMYKDSDEIKQCFRELSRKCDPKVNSAVSKSVCTKDKFPKCSDECLCDEGFFCPECCVQQKAFRCYTCDKDEIKYYCETCWKKNHKKHKCEEFFCYMRCSTK